MATHSSTLAWKIPRTEEPGRLQVHGVVKSRTRLSNFTFTFYFPALEKEMATHSSVLAWRIPGMGEPGGLLSMGSHIVGHNWSDLAAAAAAALWCIILDISHILNICEISYQYIYFKGKPLKESQCQIELKCPEIIIVKALYKFKFLYLKTFKKGFFYNLEKLKMYHRK